MPTAMWLGVKRVAVECTPGPRQERLCRIVAREAARGAPYPVALLESGAGVAPGDVLLKVETREAAGGHIEVRVRAEREDLRGEGGLQSSAARAFLLSERTPDKDISIALETILPWRSMARAPSPPREYR